MLPRTAFSGFSQNKKIINKLYCNITLRFSKFLHFFSITTVADLNDSGRSKTEIFSVFTAVLLAAIDGMALPLRFQSKYLCCFSILCLFYSLPTHEGSYSSFSWQWFHWIHSIGLCNLQANFSDRGSGVTESELRGIHLLPKLGKL